MFDRPPRHFRRGGFVLAVDPLDGGPGLEIGLESVGEKARHDVETAAVGSPRFDRIRGQPSMCASPKSTLLALVDRLCRKSMLARAPTLDLYEDEQISALRNQVDLDTVCSDVACHNAISSGLEKTGGLSFAFTSEPLAIIRYVSIHGWALICQTR